MEKEAMSRKQLFYKGQSVAWEDFSCEQSMTLGEFLEKYRVEARKDSMGETFMVRMHSAQWLTRLWTTDLEHQRMTVEALEAALYELRGMIDRAIDDVRSVK
jgi:hypothetical protein